MHTNRQGQKHNLVNAPEATVNKDSVSNGLKGLTLDRVYAGQKLTAHFFKVKTVIIKSKSTRHIQDVSHTYKSLWFKTIHTQTLLPHLLFMTDNTKMDSPQHPSPVKISPASGRNYTNLVNELLSASRSPRRMNSSLVRRNNNRQAMAPRRRHASKEIIRRALTPPARRTWRWLDFRPKPSRLSVMSMAA